MRQIAFMNQKGGVGKTTCVANLGAGLALRGKRVLLVDTDPQANLSIHLGQNPPEIEHTLYEVLIGNCKLEAAIRPTTVDGLSIVASDLRLSGAELDLAQTIGKETLLREAIEQTFDEDSAPDYVLIDCPPSLGVLSVNALAAANEVIVPLQAEFFALHGMGKLQEVVALVQKRLNPKLEITGIIACRFNTRTHLSKEVMAEADKHFPGKVFSTRVRENVKLAECSSYSQSVQQYAPDSNGAKDYEALVTELIARDNTENEKKILPLEPARDKSPGAGGSVSGA